MGCRPPINSNQSAYDERTLCSEPTSRPARLVGAAKSHSKSPASVWHRVMHHTGRLDYAYFTGAQTSPLHCGTWYCCVTADLKVLLRHRGADSTASSRYRFHCFIAVQDCRFIAVQILLLHGGTFLRLNCCSQCDQKVVGSGSDWVLPPLLARMLDPLKRCCRPHE